MRGLTPAERALLTNWRFGEEATDGEMETIAGLVEAGRIKHATDANGGWVVDRTPAAHAALAIDTALRAMGVAP